MCQKISKKVVVVVKIVKKLLPYWIFFNKNISIDAGGIKLDVKNPIVESNKVE